MTSYDHSSHNEFYEYYARASQSRATLERLNAIRGSVSRLLKSTGSRSVALDVADVGCGAGTQCLIWAESGHRAHGLDVNEPLLALAKDRAGAAGHQIDFRLGSATALPWADGSMDVCLVLELLEHVAEWEACVLEATRVLRPGGVLVLTTTNKLCPRQQEFNLPLYSWYPARWKQRFERLAATTHPRLANFAKYPAVNWFSFYSLRRRLAHSGFRCFDRFDIMDLSDKSPPVKVAVLAIRKISFLRWLAHVATPGTFLLAVRERPSGSGT